ncbi:MAG: formate dehydrogenase accessory protein FdhE, partial [Desulfobacterales bacterium]|nr:formate dehydrogenase accessory protein FdhE [Desulfobacterales bacterium]
EILNFYGRIFKAQEESKSRIRIDPIHISEEMLSLKVEEKFPLVTVPEFVIDADAAGELFGRICRTALKTGGEMAEEAENIGKALDSGDLEIQSVFSSLLEESDDYLARMAESLGLNGEILGVLAYSSIKPSLELCAVDLSTRLDPDASWDKGYCPICGNPPALSVLRDQGARGLVCGFCSHEWASKRIYCPFCENTDSETLQYFYSDDE